jgi:hypothetical protein
MSNLEDLVDRLICAQMEFVIVGGFAVLAHGASMMTEDVDVCCPFSERNMNALWSGVRDLHPVHRMTPQRLPFEVTPELCSSLKNLYLATDLGKLDCLGEIPGVGAFEEVHRRSVEIRFESGVCRVLGIDALIDAKLTTNRTLDRMAVLQLKAIKERTGS